LWLRLGLFCDGLNILWLKIVTIPGVSLTGEGKLVTVVGGDGFLQDLVVNARIIQGLAQDVVVKERN
jgi:hypothetical protein